MIVGHVYLLSGMVGRLRGYLGSSLDGWWFLFARISIIDGEKWYSFVSLVVSLVLAGYWHVGVDEGQRMI